MVSLSREPPAEGALSGAVWVGRIGNGLSAGNRQLPNRLLQPASASVEFQSHHRASSSATKRVMGPKKMSISCSVQVGR